jgi:4-diphosphocytidyl-2-C-methyl-D-erythritol kinase
VFVFGRNAFAEGVGEELTAIDLPQRWYVVVQPDASVPTADVFRAPELTRDTPRVKIADFPRGTFDPYGNSYRNDLENVVFARFSEVGRISAVLAQALGGARVRMSGSGACLFVECDTKAQADGAVDRIAATMQVQPSGLPALRVNLACAGLDAHPLLDWAA